MMNWIRYEHGFKAIYNGMLLTLTLFLFCAVFGLSTLAACFASVFAMLAFQNYYFSKIGEGLTVRFKAKQKRILIGHDEELIMEFENGRVPIWNGTLVLSMEDAVAPKNLLMKNFSGIYDIYIPFAIGRHETIEIRIPLEGKKRGKSRITRVLLEIPHMFGDGSVNMELKDVVSYQSIVYPRITKLGRELTPSPFKPGEFQQRQSLFVDPFQPIGTRDYMPNDRFDQIHWSASARMQKLQTKEFQPISAQMIVLMMNALEKDRGYHDFEAKIERLVAYADYCTKNDIPYAVAINLRTLGGRPYLFIPNGSGKLHFQEVMEMLAQISDRYAKMPFEEMMKHMESSGQLSPTIVLISHVQERFQRIVHQWEKRYTVTVDTSFERDENGWEKPELKMTGTDSVIPSA